MAREFHFAGTGIFTWALNMVSPDSHPTSTLLTALSILPRYLQHDTTKKKYLYTSLAILFCWYSLHPSPLPPKVFAKKMWTEFYSKVCSLAIYGSLWQAHMADSSLMASFRSGFAPMILGIVATGEENIDHHCYLKKLSNTNHWERKCCHLKKLKITGGVTNITSVFQKRKHMCDFILF